MRIENVICINLLTGMPQLHKKKIIYLKEFFFNVNINYKKTPKRKS